MYTRRNNVDIASNHDGGRWRTALDRRGGEVGLGKGCFFISFINIVVAKRWNEIF